MNARILFICLLFVVLLLVNFLFSSTAISSEYINLKSECFKGYASFKIRYLQEGESCNTAAQKSLSLQDDFYCENSGGKKALFKLLACNDFLYPTFHKAK